MRARVRACMRAHMRVCVHVRAYVYRRLLGLTKKGLVCVCVRVRVRVYVCVASLSWFDR